MLTKNFYSHMGATMVKGSGTFTLVDGSSKSQDYTGFTVAYADPPFVAMKAYAPAHMYGVGVIFGTGTTAPTANDYCLEKPINSGLTVTTPSATTYNRTDEYEEYTVTFGVTASSTVTISEIGLICAIAGTSTTRTLAMVDRTVLENPIEIPAGQSKQITYTIRFNYPKE